MKTIDWEYLAQHMHPREPESDKNTYGRVLAVCGLWIAVRRFWQDRVSVSARV